MWKRSLSHLFLWLKNSLDYICVCLLFCCFGFILPSVFRYPLKWFSPLCVFSVLSSLISPAGAPPRPSAAALPAGQHGAWSRQTADPGPWREWSPAAVLLRWDVDLIFSALCAWRVESAEEQGLKDVQGLWECSRDVEEDPGVHEEAEMVLIEDLEVFKLVFKRLPEILE